MLKINDFSQNKNPLNLLWKIVICFFFTLILFMHDAEASIFDKYIPSTGDYSVSYLKVLFGETKGPGILDMGQKGNDSLFAVLVRTANTFFLKIAIFVLIYQIIAITLDSARSGRFLGEKGSYWLPLRAVVGSGLLIQVGNYCLGQIIVMYIICLGIGLGNTVYTAIVNFGPGSTTTSSTSSTPISVVKVEYLKPLVDGALCVALLREKSGGDRVFTVGFDDITSQLYFGGSKLNPCIRTESIQSSQPELIANKVVPDSETQSLNRRLASLYTDLSEDLIVLFSKYVHEDLLKHANDPWNNNLTPLRRDIRIVISNFQDEMLTYQKNLCQTTFYRKNDQGFCSVGSVDEKLKFGWLGAGMYFRSYLKSTDGQRTKYPIPRPLNTIGGVQPNNQLGDSLIAQNTEVTYVKYYNEGSSCLTNHLVKEILNNLAGKSTAYTNCNGETVGVSNNSNNAQKNVVNPNDALTAFNAAAKFNDSIIQRYAEWFSSNSGQSIFQAYSSDKAKWLDPFDAVVNKGGETMRSEAASYLGLTIPIVLFHLVAHILGGTGPVGHVWDVISTILMAILTINFTIYYTLGSMAAITLPLVPMIIYLIAGIGWFVQVIFSVVSAPIVAIGIIWPDKNEGFMGKSVPAVMMYLNLLLRPALMVVGLFTGVILCAIGFYLIIAMFALATQNGILQNRWADAFAQLVYGSAFFSLMIAVAQKTFSMITLLPDRVLTWIGGSASSWSFTQDTRTILSSAKEGADKGAKEAIRLNKSSTEAAIEVGKSGGDYAKAIIDEIVDEGMDSAGT